MFQELYEKAVQAARLLTPEEQRRLRNVLIDWLDAMTFPVLPERGGDSEAPLPESDERERRLAQEAEVRRFECWTPIDIPGKPLSETIIEERR
jgi:hypothetical protein